MNSLKDLNSDKCCYNEYSNSFINNFYDISILLIMRDFIISYPNCKSIKNQRKFDSRKVAEKCKEVYKNRLLKWKNHVMSPVAEENSNIIQVSKIHFQLI